MNKRHAKKAMTKYMHGRPLTGREKACLSRKFPVLNFDDHIMMQFTGVIDQTKATFEDIARAYDLPSMQVLGYVVGGLLEQVRASMPTAEEWVRAMLTLGCGDWGMQMPLYRWS